MKKSLRYLIASIGISYVSFVYFRENYLVSALFVVFFGSLIFWNERSDIKALLKRKS